MYMAQLSVAPLRREANGLGPLEINRGHPHVIYSRANPMRNLVTNLSRPGYTDITLTLTSRVTPEQDRSQNVVVVPGSNRLLWKMTLGSSPIHRAITLLYSLDVPGSANPLPSRAFGTKPVVQRSSMRP